MGPVSYKGYSAEQSLMNARIGEAQALQEKEALLGWHYQRGNGTSDSGVDPVPSTSSAGWWNSSVFWRDKASFYSAWEATSYPGASPGAAGSVSEKPLSSASFNTAWGTTKGAIRILPSTVNARSGAGIAHISRHCQNILVVRGLLQRWVG